MPRSEGTKHLQVYMSQEAFEVVTEYIKSQGLTISDYLRGLIETDMLNHGVPVDFGMKWGRTGKDEDED